MWEIIEYNNLLLVRYEQDITYGGREDWVQKKLSGDESYKFKKIFNFNLQSIIDIKIDDDDDDDDEEDEDFRVYYFKLGELNPETGYYIIAGSVFGYPLRSVLIHKDINISMDTFYAEDGISVIAMILELMPGNLVIGGDKKEAIEAEAFENLIHNFPNTYEKRLYAKARISSQIREFSEDMYDGEELFRRYEKRKLSQNIESKTIKLFKEEEIVKFETLYEKLTRMLDDEINYSEAKWQAEILPIVRLLFPKYIAVLSSVSILTDVGRRELDYVLVDANGSIDIVEIKKPFEDKVMSKSQYRNNYVPLRELTGGIMQAEKYIYHLNRLGKTGEEKLTKKYEEELPDDFSIKITNPQALILMGREKGLTLEQLADFEVVKRKYRNMVDIITYDDLLRRLGYIIEQLKKI